MASTLVRFISLNLDIRSDLIIFHNCLHRGKHPPASWRYHNVAYAERNKKVNQTLTLAVATIKDPLTWMGSMCRHSYAAVWRHSPKHCPNLVSNEVDKGLGVKSGKCFFTFR